MTALNRFLEEAAAIQIGDASTVFWADASDAGKAEEAEGFFAALLGADAVDESVQAKKVGAILQAIREGRPIRVFKPDLWQGVRFFVLGLAPNAARLAVRLYIEDDFGVIAQNLGQHLLDLHIEPWPSDRPPAAWALANEASVHIPQQGPNGRLTWVRPRNSEPPAILVGPPARLGFARRRDYSQSG